MQFREAIKNQTHAALAMLAECVEACPPTLWESGDHPKLYWRTAYHTTAFADCFLSPSLEAWTRWSHHRPEATQTFSDDGSEVPVLDPYSPEQILEYVKQIDASVDERIDALNLEDDECGFPWYPGLSRTELLILNARHVSEHVGQLHQMRIAAGLDVDWRSSRDY